MMWIKLRAGSHLWHVPSLYSPPDAICGQWHTQAETANGYDITAKLPDEDVCPECLQELEFEAEQEAERMARAEIQAAAPLSSPLPRETTLATIIEWHKQNNAAQASGVYVKTTSEQRAMFRDAAEHIPLVGYLTTALHWQNYPGHDLTCDISRCRDAVLYLLNELEILEAAMQVTRDKAVEAPIEEGRVNTRCGKVQFCHPRNTEISYGPLRLYELADD